ncbi:NAD(P)-dependent oxidoreductase [Acinetobacter sp. NCu2D-2]|uniref:SDR family oxidoreductase n=1 Tax=Acinetobacter sp. NCu2D-2 TaxID=1608473 RepID=UPI0007CDB3B5|nr:SDR family oxidoreductase [Acinetobacter sp. NCu2D-2]ANF81476.1 NAD(P)-dependent oxidoreductase [Acinetobacter sp. NCu2D-2]
MKIAITGATGQLGQLVIQHLLKLTDAENIIVLVRHTDKAASFKAQGIDVRHFDYDQAETLQPALQGIDKLLLISANEIGRRTPQHKAVIEAAKAAHVPYIAYTSLLNGDSSPLGLAQEHRETEQLIRESGLAYTFLRNNWYVENYLGSIQQDIASGVIYGAAQDGQINAAPRSDYAEAAARVLVGNNHDGKTYELASSQSFTKATLAQTISQVSGKTVRYEDLTPEAYKSLLVKVGLDAAFSAFLADVDFKTSHGVMATDRKDLEALLSHPTTSLSTVIRNSLNA